jgi:(1->4)-alpha-D-glucan 1-alpha-D-glucosylmutase
VYLILDSAKAAEFLDDLIEFVQPVSHAGILNSLSQTLIKITAPGIPDFYQGTELWDFNLVDPDNRRPVDFGMRQSCWLQSVNRTMSDRRWRVVCSASPKTARSRCS